MSDTATPPVVAAPAAPAKVANKAPVEAKEAREPEPDEEFEIDGKKQRLTRTQQRTFIQKAAAADKRMQEAAEAKRSQDEWDKLFDADPEAALKKRGKDPEKALQTLMERRAKEALLTPEQREKAKVEKERDDARAEAKKLADEKKAEEDAKADRETETALEQDLIAAADEYGLEGDPETLEGLCDVALDLLEMGLKPSPAQIAQEFMRREEEFAQKKAPKVVAKLKGDRLKAHLQALPLAKLQGAELLDALGPELVKAIQTATLTRVPSPAAPVRTPAAAPPRNGAGRFTTEAEFNKKFNVR